VQIEYRLDLAYPHTHEFAVTLRLDGVGAAPLRLSLPAWIPGSYMIRDFSRNIRDLSIKAGDRPVRFDKLDKQTWEVPEPASAFAISYRVYALDESVRSAYFDDTRAYFNGTSLFLRVHGQEERPHQLYIEAPVFSGSEAWRVATTLPPEGTDNRGFGRYEGAGYRALIDHPVEIGVFQELEFEVRGVPHQMVFVDAAGTDIERIGRDVPPICAEHAAMYGDLPVDKYLFQTLATRDGYGGLEHSDSTSLICRRSDLPWPGKPETSKGYRQYLALCSHEYFHLWNVKRIRPEAFASSDLSQEAHSELLWAFEGITSYYDELALPRSGVLPRSDYLDLLAPSLTRYYRNVGRHRQSIAESSFDAWTKFYKQDESAPSAIVSYYNKGALVALGLDRLIRLSSDDQLSLDDLMRYLWQHYGVTDKGVPERAIELGLARLIGQPVEEFFERYIYGVEELPLADWFGGLGVGIQLRSGTSLKDQGGFVEQPNSDIAATASLGARVSTSDGLVRVNQVFSSSAAEQAGITPGDLLVAIDGERCTEESLQELLTRTPVGETVRMSLFRRDRLRQVEMPVMAAPCDTVDLYWLPDEGLSERVIQRRENWLRSATSTADG